MPISTELDLHRDPGDETDYVRPAVETSTIIVRSNIAAMQAMTDEQRQRVSELATSWRAGFVTLRADDWNSKNIEFSLWTSDPQRSGKHLLSGLIEPDGRSHT